MKLNDSFIVYRTFHTNTRSNDNRLHDPFSKEIVRSIAEEKVVVAIDASVKNNQKGGN